MDERNRQALLRELGKNVPLARALRQALFFAKQNGRFPRWVWDPTRQAWEMQVLTLAQSLQTLFHEEYRVAERRFLENRLRAMKNIVKLRPVELFDEQTCQGMDRESLQKLCEELGDALIDYRILCTHAAAFGWYPRWVKDEEVSGTMRQVYDQRLDEALAHRTQPDSETVDTNLQAIAWLKHIAHTPCAKMA